MEIPGVMERYGEKSINSINNMIVHVAQMICDRIGLAITFSHINSTTKYYCCMLVFWYTCLSAFRC